MPPTAAAMDDDGAAPPPPPPRYIVIGAGPAGCAVAAALAEGQAGGVVLLEMGPDLRDRSKVDKANDWVKAAFTSRNSQIYWTPPHGHLGGRVFLTPRGIGPGGTGLVNAMQYSRGYESDYASWPWALEAIERSYEHVEARLRAAGALTQAAPCLVGLAFEKAAAEAAPGLRVVGPHDPPPSSASAAATAAPNGNGNKVSPYYLTPESYAPMCYVARRRRPHPTSTQTLTRVSPFEAFITPLLSGDRPSPAPLRVVYNARSSRLLFDAEKRATGVEYLDTSSPKSPTLQTLHLDPHDPTAEIVVCAGAIETPKLLLLSGIGDSGSLGALGIPVVAPLPSVGKGLKDHLLAPVCGFSRVNMSNRKEAMRAPNAMYGWVNVVRGGHSDTGEAAEMRLSIMTTDFSVAPDLVPEMALPRYPGRAWTALRWLVSGLLRLLLLFPCMRWLARQMTGCLVCVMNPKSAGAVRLASADPLVPPVVDPAYLTDAQDVAALQEGIDLARRMLDSDAMRPLRLGPQLLPGGGFNHCQTREDTARFAALFAGSYYHPACSCRLGEVVDASLRVQGGVQGLRLADASVLPDLGSAGPVGSCFMLGDRCARLILEAAAAAAEQEGEEEEMGGKGRKGRGPGRGRRRQ